MKKYKFTDDWFSHNIPKWEKFLKELKNKPVNCLEIGSYEGRSGLWLHDNILTHPDSHLTMIEPGYSGVTPTLELNLSICDSDKISLLHLDSRDICISDSMNSFDLIYIDGSHSAHDVIRDGCICFELLKVGGILCFDDYNWKKEDADGTSPKIAIDSFLCCYQPYIEVIDIGYQVWIRKIK